MSSAICVHPKWPLDGSIDYAAKFSVGATKLSEGVVKGAEATGRAIQKGGTKIRDRITPEETPSDVSPHVTRGLNVAKKATGGALRVSQFLGKNVQIRDKNKKTTGSD